MSDETADTAPDATASEEPAATADAPAPEAPAEPAASVSTPDGGSDEPAVEEPEVIEFVQPTREEELEQQLSELQARLRAVSAAYQKQQEEVVEVRKRLERQAALKEEMRRGEVVAGLFEPVENLKRSIDAAGKGASVEDTVTGLQMVQSQFMDAFKKLGLEEVPGQGAKFDPNLHEALTLIPVTDPAMDDVVIDVFSAGYRIGSRLIVPAKVVVGRLADAAEA